MHYRTRQMLESYLRGVKLEPNMDWRKTLSNGREYRFATFSPNSALGGNYPVHVFAGRRCIASIDLIEDAPAAVEETLGARGLHLDGIAATHTAPKT